MNSIPGYSSYSVFLFIVTGILMLFIDVKGYKLAKRKKEQNYTHILGWVNIGIGGTFYLANWIYTNWFV